MSVVDRVRALQPLLADHDLVAARERRIPAPMFDALREAGVHRLLTPSRYGGEPVDLATVLATIEAVAVGSGAAGWNLATSSAAASAVACLGDEGLDEIFGRGPDVSFAGAAIPGPGKATTVEGGHLVSGHWAFGSGSLDARWLVTVSPVVDDGNTLRVLYLDRADIEIVDTWNTVGLAGTGSNDWISTDAFVPLRRSAIARATARWPDSDFELPFAWFAALHFSAVATGLARRAVDGLVELASTKVPVGSTHLLRDRPQVEDAVGRAEFLLESARAYRDRVLGECWGALHRGEPATEEQTAMLRLAGTAAVESSVKACELMYRAGGTSVIHASSPIGNAFRDVEVIAQGITVNQANIQLAGRALLQRDGDTC